MQKNKKQIGEDFWLRVDSLIGGENPYSWAASHGINKSTFQSAIERGTKPLDRTVEKWANKIGVDYNWLNTGVGVPYKSSDAAEKSVEARQPPVAERLATVDTDGIDMQMMIEALTIVEDHLAQHNKRMDADKKAELIVHIYDLLCKTPDAGHHITTMLQLAV